MQEPFEARIEIDKGFYSNSLLQIKFAFISFFVIFGPVIVYILALAQFAMCIITRLVILYITIAM